MSSGRFGEGHGGKPVFGALEPRVLLSASGELVESAPKLGSNDDAVLDRANEVEGVPIAAANAAAASVDGSSGPVSGQEAQTQAAMASVAGPAMESAAETANQPIGEAKGIYPGRVAWVLAPRR